MRKCILLFAIALVLIAGGACKREGVNIPDEVLVGLQKPVISGVAPTAIRASGAGFCLSVTLSVLDSAAQYTLYINDQKVGQVNRDNIQYSQEYASLRVGWMVPWALLQKLLLPTPNGGVFSVRVTGIGEEYDVSGDFDRYRDYVSEPALIEISRGETQFAEAKRLFPEWAHSRQPVSRCDPRGNIYLAWREKLNGVCKAFFSFSADGGETWSQALDISRSAAPVYEIDLAADGSGHIFMAWTVRNDLGSSIYFCRSLDGGATWDSPAGMDGKSKLAEILSLLVSDRGDVFLAWKRWDYPENCLAISRDLGRTWHERLFPLPDPYWGWSPILGSQGGMVYLLNGRKSSNLEFDLHSTRDYGITWQAEKVQVGGNVNSFADHPLLRFGPQGQLFLAWGYESHSGGHGETLWNYFLRRDGTGQWSVIQSLRQRWLSDSSVVALAVSGQSVDVAAAGRGCLFLSRSADGGQSWSVPEAVAGSEGYLAPGWPDMALHPSGKTFLVFVKKTSPEDGGLYLTRFD